MTILIPPSVLALLLIYKDGFGIKQPMKVDMPLNKETKERIDVKTTVVSKTSKQRQFDKVRV